MGNFGQKTPRANFKSKTNCMRVRKNVQVQNNQTFASPATMSDRMNTSTLLESAHPRSHHHTQLKPAVSTQIMLKPAGSTQLTLKPAGSPQLTLKPAGSPQLTLKPVGST